MDAAVHKGMPHKYYHGRTGVIWNVTKRSVGVEMNKQVQAAFEHPDVTLCRFYIPNYADYSKNAEYAKRLYNFPALGHEDFLFSTHQRGAAGLPAAPC